MGMGLFAKTRKLAGWLAINIQEDGIYAAHVKRVSAAKPSVELLTFYPATQEALETALEKFTKERHAERYECTTLLTPAEYQLLSVDAPNVSQEELKAAIRWRLKDMLDFHVDDATIDVLDVPADKNAPARNRSMYAVAARNQLIEQCQARFTLAKIPLSVIDIPEMAQRNIAALVEQQGRGLALLSFDARGGLLTLTYAGELYLSRRIDITLQQLQADAAQGNNGYDRITLELQRSLDHFDRQYHFITLSKLMLAPLGDVARGLRDYLAANLYLPVEWLDLESVLDISKAEELKQPGTQQQYFLTLGAALRHEEKVL